MKRRLLVDVLAVSALAMAMPLCPSAEAQPVLVPLSGPQLGQRLEFSITNVPAASNPFDPDVIRLDATFVLPSGGTRVVPAFWYQAYQRALVGGYEQDTPVGNPGWRLRFPLLTAGKSFRRLNGAAGERASARRPRENGSCEGMPAGCRQKQTLWVH